MGPNCLNLWNPNLVSVAVTGCWVVNWYNLCHKSYCDMHRAGNGCEVMCLVIYVINHIVICMEPMIGDFPGIVTEGFTIPDNSVHKIIFVK